MCAPARADGGGTRPWRACVTWLAILLTGGVLLAAGCTPGSMGYFNLMMNPNLKPDWFDFTQKKPNARVVFLVCHTSAQTQANTDLFNADQLLATRLNQVLTKVYKENHDQVQLVS